MSVRSHTWPGTSARILRVCDFAILAHPKGKPACLRRRRTSDPVLACPKRRSALGGTTHQKRPAGPSSLLIEPEAVRAGSVTGGTMPINEPAKRGRMGSKIQSRSGSAGKVCTSAPESKRSLEGPCTDGGGADVAQTLSGISEPARARNMLVHGGVNAPRPGPLLP